jgi:hypothetical protein
MPSILILGSNYQQRMNMYNKINSNGKFCSPYYTNLYKQNTIYVADRIACDYESKLEYVINTDISNNSMNSDFLLLLQTSFPKATILFNPDDETLRSALCVD